MTDLIPDESHPLARWVNRLFHPFVVALPTSVVLLQDVPWDHALGWMAVLFGMLLPPLILTTLWLKRRNRFAYQRHARAPIYGVFILSVLVCLGVLVALDAPRILIACLVALLIWTPGQLLMNTFITKISIHTAVLAGCLSAVWVSGKLDHPSLLLGATTALGLTVWARIVTKHHTLPQVMLGVLVGMLPVLLVFPVLL